MHVRRALNSLLAALLLAGIFPAQADAQRATRVRAVLFYSPTCPHCHQVLSVDLPPLAEKYGARLQVLLINTKTAAGAEAYQASVQHFQVPRDRQGVPTLIVGSTVLVGSGEIPEQFPGIVERGLAGEGIGWPAVAALEPLLRAEGLLEDAAAPGPVRPGQVPGRGRR